MIKRHEKLEKVRLGATGPMVTVCCAGTMNWGSFTEDESSAHAQLDLLFEMGVNFIDTAELYPVAFNYGKTTEKWIGNWLKLRNIKREDFVVASKINPAGIGSTGQKHQFEADVMLNSCKLSLERLQLDYLDLYYIHWPSRDIPCFGPATYQSISPTTLQDRESQMKVFEHFETMVLGIKNLLDLGLIKHWGISNENAFGVSQFCQACDKLGVVRPCVIQNDFSLNNRVYEGDCLEACARYGIQGLHYGALSGGALSGKYCDLDLDDPNVQLTDDQKKWRFARDKSYQWRYRNKFALEAVKKYVDLAAEYGLTSVEMSYAWSRQRWYTMGVIIGTSTVDQVKEAVNSCMIELPEELLKKIDLIHEQYRNPTALYASDEALKTTPWISKV